MYTSSPTSLVFLVTVLSGVCQGYWRMGCGTVQTGRLDPVVSPGKINAHVHKISGPSNFGLNSTYDSLQTASCTSCSVQADKSAYWTPQLYYHHSNGSFEEVPNGGHVIYYLGRGENKTNIRPFPPGFRMVSGDAAARAYNNVTYTFGGTAGETYVSGTSGSGTLTGGTFIDKTKASGPRYTGRPVSDRTSFNCLSVSPSPETPNMIRTNCVNGLRAQIHFQSCWDGVNLYKADNSHVAYMSQIDNGVCPPTYPIQLVHLFFEVLYWPNAIKQDGGQFVFSQGDTTGYGFHGDFLNGWDMPTQTAALAQCANTDNFGQISACAPLAASDSMEASTNCPQQPALVNEPARGMISKLPGCINITDGPSPATAADMICPANAIVPSVNPTPASTGPTTTFLPSVGSTYNKWKYLGCSNDSATDRVLTGASYTDTIGMTNQACQAFCASKNFPLAGTEYGSECWCGQNLEANAALGQSCNGIICSGNSSQLCGGRSRLSVWNSTAYKAATTIAPGTAVGSSTYLGCASEGTNSRALTGASYTDGKMTNDVCAAYCASRNFALFGTEYGQECYCSNALAPGASLGQTGCTMPCSGNLPANSPLAAYPNTCGGAQRLSLWNNTLYKPVRVVPSVGKYVSKGCYSEGTKGRALVSASWAAPNMTVEGCVGYCQGKGWGWAGLEYGQECYCGSGISNGGSPVAGGAGCGMLCAGSPFEYCGGAGSLNVYVSG